MTQRRYLLDGMHPFLQLLFLASITLIASASFTLLGMYLVRPLFGVTAIDTLTQSAIDNPESIASNAAEVNALKFLQFMASFGTFIIPTLMFAFAKFPGGDFLRLNVRTPFLFAFLGILILVSSTPFIDFTYEVNQMLKFPSFMSGMEKQIQDAENASDQLTLLFLKTPRKADLGINLLVLAIIPAIGEELMFRGCIQQLMKEWTKKIHVAVWVSAAIFSFVHFEFYGFLPRLLLGALLGYLFVWSGSLWIPIIAHAFNNGAQVVLAYLHEHHIIQFDVTSDNPLPVYLTIVATILCAAFIYAFRKLESRKRFIY